MSIDEALPQGEPENFEVKEQRPVFNIIDVVLDSFFDGGISPPPVNLCPPGDSGLHLVAEHVAGDLFSELLDEERPFRPGADNAHIPLKYVDKLRQFIE